jgi:hypothetical protein
VRSLFCAAERMARALASSCRLVAGQIGRPRSALSSYLACSQAKLPLPKAPPVASYYDMTKRSRDVAIAPSHSEDSGRRLSHDGDGTGSPEDADGSALKKARSFMATLVSEKKLVFYLSLMAIGV